MELVDFIVVVPIIIILSGLTGSMITLNYIRSHSIPEAKVDNTLANGNFTNTLHPLVKEIYELFVDDKTVDNFKERCYNIYIGEIAWWGYNELYNREFTSIPVDIQKKYNTTTKEINDSLSLADKKVLDHITQQVITNNKEFINRLFL